MTNQCILQVTLVLWFSTAALSLNYDLLRFQQSDTSLACQELLRQLNGTPQYCLDDRVDFKFPEEIRQPQEFHKQDAVLVIHEMLQQIFLIFRRNFSSTGWDKAIVENLYMELSQQMDRLEIALEEITKKENFAWRNRATLPLKKYYLKIVRYLKAKLYSRCAWTVVQEELRTNFFILNSLTDYLQN